MREKEKKSEREKEKKKAWCGGLTLILIFKENVKCGGKAVVERGTASHLGFDPIVYNYTCS